MFIFSRLTKFLFILTILFWIVAVTYNNFYAAQGLVGSKLAVQQLQNSDAAYLAMATYKSINKWLYIFALNLTFLTFFSGLRDNK